MFVDEDTYMNKLKTCARTRTFENRFLRKDNFNINHLNVACQNIMITYGY